MTKFIPMFFADMPFEVQKVISSYFKTADDFIAVLQASREAQRAIETILFNKTGATFYLAQHHILTIVWINKGL